MKLVSVGQVFNFQIPKPCEDLSQIFPNGITTFFRITMRVPCTCLFSRTCSNSLLTSWFDIICIEAIVCYNPEPFQATLYIIISFASQIWAVKKNNYPFCFGDKPRYKPIDQKNNDLPSLELGNSSQSLGNKISLGLLMELATSKFGVGIRWTITTKKEK